MESRNPVGGSVIFYLVNAKPVCCQCIPENLPVNPIPVMRENVHPYSQECSRCYKRCYTGTHNENLFPIEYDGDVMNETIYKQYKAKIIEQLPAHKAEAREIRMEFLERCIRAKIKGKMFLENDQLIDAMNKTR